MSIKNVSIKEEKLRAFHLRNLALGNIYGPLTGKASVDKPWLKYSSEEEIEESIVESAIGMKHSIAEGMSNSATKYAHLNSSRYIKSDMTYEKSKEMGDMVAKALVASGVKKGDIVTVCLPCVPEFGYFFYAINKVGAISNWIDFRTGEAELVECLNNVNSKLAVTFDGVCEKVNNSIKKHNDTSENKIEQVIKVSPQDSLPLPIATIMNINDKLHKNNSPIKEIEIPYKEFLKKGQDVLDFDPVKFDADDTAVIVYTGGTTGTPKGVELTNKNFNAVVQGYKNSKIDFNKGDSFLHFLPPWTAYGMVIYYLLYQMGVKCIFIPKLDPATYDKLILRERPTHTTGIPKNLDILLGSKNIKANTDLSFFKTAAVGADTMNINTEMKVNTFLEKHGSCAKVIKGYGATEGNGTIATTSNKINKIGSVGIPFIGNNIGIFDMDNNQELTYGQKGEICYCGDSVMKKYYNNDAETKKVLKMHDDGKVWMHSGDIGYIDNDGFLYVVGRIKRMFVRSGFKLFSSEIENAIGSHYAVKNVAAVGVDDSIEGSVPVVSIVLKDEYNKDGLRNQILEEINDICKYKLFEYYMPLNYRIVDNIPYTKNGKVDFMALKKESQEYLKPNTEKNKINVK